MYYVCTYVCICIYINQYKYWLSMKELLLWHQATCWGSGFSIPGSHCSSLLQAAMGFFLKKNVLMSQMWWSSLPGKRDSYSHCFQVFPRSEIILFRPPTFSLIQPLPLSNPTLTPWFLRVLFPQTLWWFPVYPDVVCHLDFLQSILQLHPTSSLFLPVHLPIMFCFCSKDRRLHLGAWRYVEERNNAQKHFKLVKVVENNSWYRVNQQDLW